MDKIITVILTLFSILAISVSLWASWTLGNKSGDYDIVCIGKHEYYKASLFTKGFLGIKLNDNGNPILCDE